MKNLIKRITELKNKHIELLKLPLENEAGIKDYNDYIEARIKTYNQCIEVLELCDMNNFSDGYHTFEELYFHRMILFSVICKQNKEKAWRSKLHNDGTMFNDYFVVGIETGKGQYTYHYHIKYWNEFAGVKEIDKAPEWDGHIPADIVRLKDLNKKE